MYIALAVLFLFLNLAVHEAAHAFYMIKHGVDIKEAGLGLPMGRLSLTLRPKFLSFPIKFSPLLLGAYVMPSPAGEITLTGLDQRKRAQIFGAGVLANIAMCAVTIAVLSLTYETIISPNMKTTILTLCICAIVLLLVKKFNAQISHYIIPMLGLAMFGLIAYKIGSAFFSNFGYAVVHGGAASPIDNPVATGPVGIVGFLGVINNLKYALFFGADIALGLALMNIIPLHPFDGGKIMGDYVARFLGSVGKKIHMRFSICFLLGFLLLIFINDIRN